MTGLHLAYFLREGDNEELRYSLRSAQENLPDIDTIWVVGGKPDWLTNVEHISKGNPYPDKQRNVYANVRTIAEHPDLPPEVVIMNDDFLTLHPATPEPAWRCRLTEHINTLRQAWWRWSLETTLKWLKQHGHPDPLSYELHRPFPINRTHMAQALADAADVQPDNPPQWRTLYGNLYNIGGQQEDDGKLYGTTAIPPPGLVWASTTDRGWNRSCCLRAWLAGRFHKPSRWET